MSSINEQFQFLSLPGYFEPDTNLELLNVDIDKLHILYGNHPNEDIVVVTYRANPNLSFYDAYGKLIDVDHSLPDQFKNQDGGGAEMLIANLKISEPHALKDANSFRRLINETLIDGSGNLDQGIKHKFGLHGILSDEQEFIPGFGNDQAALEQHLVNNYKSYYDFLKAYIVKQQVESQGYVHITVQGNIIITTLNKNSGIAVIIETRDANGQLLSPNKWIITRTLDKNKFKQALIFRSKDIQDFFDGKQSDEIFITDRYKLFHTYNHIALDSLVDNTDNLYKTNLVNDCFQILASDKDIIVALSSPKEVTIINTHLSVTPTKWPKKIVLAQQYVWFRVDENLSFLFAQLRSGEVQVFDITSGQAELIANIGRYAHGFELDQNGNLILKLDTENKLIKLDTNIYEIELPSDKRNFATVFKNLSHLFKGENLFTKIQFAKTIEEKIIPENKKMPSAFETARYDFETNIDHMLLEAGDSYDKLLEVQEKIAIARQNISEELTSQAEQEGILLVGQRLKTTLNTILRPSELKVNNLVEMTRSVDILHSVREFKDGIQNLSDPNSYREILNTLRKYDSEYRVMHPDNRGEYYTEFKLIQSELNVAFSNQISEDGNALNSFISGEIEQIEEAIKNTFDQKRLETLLSVHPAAQELFSLLKQPFVLQNIAKENKLSPAAIQSRLYTTASNRQAELAEQARKKELEEQAAKTQLTNMIRESIDFFVSRHSGEFSDLELSTNANYQALLSDISRVEKNFNDYRLSMELRRSLELKIIERNRDDLEKMVAFEGKYAFVQNDADLYIDLNSTLPTYPIWNLVLNANKGDTKNYFVSFVRSTDKEVYRPSTFENLEANKSFELTDEEFKDFSNEFDRYIQEEYSFEFLDAIWNIHLQKNASIHYPQFNAVTIDAMIPKKVVAAKALRCALEKKKREHQEKTRERAVPKITPEFIDHTPYFQEKLAEFVIKAKLQLLTGSGVILLSGPPSTGKSAFLKFAAAIMNREYFEHASDKWQTKNSLVTAIKFGEFGPYAIPAGFTKAITTPYSLINIEEIKEWPEALRKSLNPFFAGSKEFIAPDGTKYKIGENILLCAAANLGSMYRDDDEPFTADFWSRIEVVEYGYAPLKISQDYYERLFNKEIAKILTCRDLARQYFNFYDAPTDPKARAIHFAQSFLEFTLLPKADEIIKKENIQGLIIDYYNNVYNEVDIIGPEEAAKVALKRIKDFRNYTPIEFFDLYNHFVNESPLRSTKLSKMQSADIDKYLHLKVIILTLRYIEGGLRALREEFYLSAGQTEIEGTNREFIKCAYLLGLLGKM